MVCLIGSQVLHEGISIFLETIFLDAKNKQNNTTFKQLFCLMNLNHHQKKKEKKKKIQFWTKCTLMLRIVKF